MSTSLNMLEASGAAASMFARARTLVTLEAMSGQLFRRSGRTRSCLSRFLMSKELLAHVTVLVTPVVNFRRDCTGFEFRITKDGTQQLQLMLIYCRKQDRYTSRC